MSTNACLGAGFVWIGLLKRITFSLDLSVLDEVVVGVELFSSRSWSLDRSLTAATPCLVMASREIQKSE